MVRLFSVFILVVLAAVAVTDTAATPTSRTPTSKLVWRVNNSYPLVGNVAIATDTRTVIFSTTSLTLQALDVDTGKQVWQKSGNYGAPRVAETSILVADGSAGSVNVLSASTGATVHSWRQNIPSQGSAVNNGIPHVGSLCWFLNAGGDLVGLNYLSGAVKFISKSRAFNPNNRVNAFVYGIEVVVTVSASTALYAYDGVTGQLLWKSAEGNSFSAVEADPVFYQGSYIAAVYDNPNGFPGICACHWRTGAPVFNFTLSRNAGIQGFASPVYNARNGTLVAPFFFQPGSYTWTKFYTINPSTGALQNVAVLDITTSAVPLGEHLYYGGYARLYRAGFDFANNKQIFTVHPNSYDSSSFISIAPTPYEGTLVFFSDQGNLFRVVVQSQ